MGNIARRYAKAIYAYAAEQKAEEQLYGELQTLLPCFTKVEGFGSALNNPMISLDDKHKLLENAAGGKPSEEYQRAMNLVLQHKRTDYLQAITLMYINLYRKAKNIVTGTLITATPLSQKAIDGVQDVLQRSIDEHSSEHGQAAATLQLTDKVNPDILGGFIFDYDTYRLDASVRLQMALLKAAFTENNKRII